MKIKKIYLVFKTHHDIGFTGLAKDVVSKYMKEYIPKAIKTAAELDGDPSGYRFVWTLGSWFVWEFLRTETPENVAMLEDAVNKGYISWLGLPFTTHTEIMDLGLFEYGISLSHELDTRFGRKTLSAKMTDIPCHTKSIIDPMSEAGIKLLHIGINPANPMPGVPDTFRWVSEAGNELILTYSRDYGGLTPIGDTGEALFLAHSGDNHGPQGKDEIAKIYHSLKEQYPDAEIVASDLNIVASLMDGIRGQLPCVTQEMGDPWIGAVSSDPRKISNFRALMRLCKTAEPGKRKAAYRHMVMVPEHTWGLDVKTFLHDRDHFKRTDFDKARLELDNFKVMEKSWQEQRDYINAAAACIGDEAVAPLSEYKRALTTFSNEPFKPDVGISVNANGAVDHLVYQGKVLADADHLLCDFLYEQLSMNEYGKLPPPEPDGSYPWWIEDSMKIGMEKGIDRYRSYKPLLDEVVKNGNQIAIRCHMPDEAYTMYGCPKKIETLLTFEENKITVDFAWVDKPANRMAENIWLNMNPLVEDVLDWRVSKLGKPVNLFDAVERNGRNVAATDWGVFNRGLKIEMVDNTLVTLDPVWFNMKKPSVLKGLAFNLFNNTACTNFPMWYGEDARFRFVLYLFS